MKVHIPVFVYAELGTKRKRYDVHGVYRELVTSRAKRRDLEGDLMSEFLANNPSADLGTARIVWVTLNIPFPLDNDSGVARAVLQVSTARFDRVDN